ERELLQLAALLLRGLLAPQLGHARVGGLLGLGSDLGGLGGTGRDDRRGLLAGVGQRRAGVLLGVGQGGGGPVTRLGDEGDRLLAGVGERGAGLVLGVGQRGARGLLVEVLGGVERRRDG